MKVALVLCVAVSAVLAQVPAPCQSPPQWEGREVRVDYSQKYEEYRRIFYDETNKRVRTIAEVEFNSTKEFYDILDLYSTNQRFSINMRTRQCNVTMPDRPFHYRGVHPNAKFEQLLSLGLTGYPGESIQLAIFSANETEEFYTGTVAYPACIPVTNIHITKKYGFEHSDYFDITAGISDPMAFVPPSECIKS
ncbi:mammalian ependymin-related protein 1-like [Mizuhopecten yessoensis]|uniref:Mammalian ependymin-related protein 1 n=1 Tax=Mizuhopecten yessoensis TaxID=6573 RepID=A0A210PKV2_MIZYE|nr:mammalian ependymin-related protein 1-like [Mizuhopecten yessoensis]OWF37118.1 Mammalian ependymin-related protein 1 [Mizuhopecten yessoensis]